MWSFCHWLPVHSHVNSGNGASMQCFTRNLISIYDFDVPWLVALPRHHRSVGSSYRRCSDSNPNQSCEPDAVEDRLSAERYLYQDDEELWELLVNGKGIGLCNIRVAGAGEETDLYAYSGVLNDEGNHGYPGMHDG